MDNKRLACLMQNLKGLLLDAVWPQGLLYDDIYFLHDFADKSVDGTSRSKKASSFLIVLNLTKSPH